MKSPLSRFCFVCFVCAASVLLCSVCDALDTFVESVPLERASQVRLGDLDVESDRISVTTSAKPYPAPVGLVIPGKICASKVINGTRTKCCRDCSECQVEHTTCKHGSKGCKCGSRRCFRQLRVYKYLLKRAEKKTCYKPIQKCKKVERTVQAPCKKCTDGVEKYQCGQTCKKSNDGSDVKYKRVKVDCEIPGKCTTTKYVTKSCKSQPQKLKCYPVKLPKPVKCEKVSVKDCASVPVNKQLCMKYKTPSTNCTTLLQAAGQKCKKVHGGQVHCKKVHDGYTKECKLFTGKKTHCSISHKKEPHNCRKVKKSRPGSCITHYEKKMVCDGGLPVKQTCKIVLRTKKKCNLKLTYKKVCPTMKKKVCGSSPKRVKIPGSCKKTKRPCLYLAKRDRSRSEKVSLSQTQYKECIKTGLVCHYKIEMIASCKVKNVPKPGKKCAKVPQYVKKCVPVKVKRKVCYPSPVTVTATQGKLPPSTTCAKKGQKCAGAHGHPHFKYTPCCSNTEECVPNKEKGWGKFCMPKAYSQVSSRLSIHLPTKPHCAKHGEKCAGAKGHAFVSPKNCCDSSHVCAADPSKGWGRYCIPKPTQTARPSTCAKDGVRCKGEAGHPPVAFKRCCNTGSICKKDPSKGWGGFCVPKNKPVATPRKPGYCAKDGDKCGGAPGHPPVRHSKCCNQISECKKDPSKGWGRFCVPNMEIVGAPGSTVSPRLKKCKHVRVPVKKCSKIYYQADECDYRKVAKKKCHTVDDPMTRCKKVPKYRQDCSSTPGKVVCQDRFKQEQKCSQSTDLIEKCKNVVVHKSVCKSRTIDQCKEQGYYSKMICERGPKTKEHCETKHKTKTHTAPPTRGKCWAMVPTKTKSHSTKCTPKWCHKPRRSCVIGKCPKKEYKTECSMQKKKYPCRKPKKPLCILPKTCSLKRYKCSSKSCGKEQCGK